MPKATKARARSRARRPAKPSRRRTAPSPKRVSAESGAAAQSPQTAKHDGMPRAAIATGAVDLVLSPKEIAAELVGRHPYVRQTRRPTADKEERAPGDELHRILIMLRSSTGVDFTQYKQPTIERRLHRRMALNRIQAQDQYRRFLEENPGELKALGQDILIHVTQFFREPTSFQTLTETVFPKLALSRHADSPIRVWVPGCATGEEAYSVAITLLEFAADRTERLPIQVFATDVSDSAIEFARAGIYSQSIEPDVSAERLRRFFSKVDGSYRIRNSVRDVCVFARQDLSRDAPFSKLDLILCRNVLIYMGAELQKRVVAMFHYALNPSGYLLLAKAETIGSHGELFTAVDRKHRLYRKRELVLFHQARPALRGTHRAHRKSKRAKDGDKSATRLEQELAASRDYLQSIIQDLEAANEELQSANEAVLSANEELQSTNEELDTAKEELQSTNEELNTFNEELQGRNDELSRANSDLLNLLGSVQDAIVMIAADLRIRRFTPMAEKILNLIGGDVGRPLSHIKPSIDCPDLEQLVAGVIETMASREREVKDTQGNQFLLRIRPYKSLDNRIDGAVLVLTDVDQARRQQAALRSAVSYSDAVADMSDDPLVVVNDRMEVHAANEAFCELMQTTRERAAGRRLDEVWGAVEASLRAMMGRLPPDGPGMDVEIESELRRLGRRRLRVHARRLAADGGAPLVMLRVRDVTDEKHAG